MSHEGTGFPIFPLACFVVGLLGGDWGGSVPLVLPTSHLSQASVSCVCHVTAQRLRHCCVGGRQLAERLVQESVGRWCFHRRLGARGRSGGPSAGPHRLLQSRRGRQQCRTGFVDGGAESGHQ